MPAVLKPSLIRGGSLLLFWILYRHRLKHVKTNLISFDIPRRSGIFNEIELDITESYTASELLEKLASDVFTAVQVVTAFSKRAALAQQLVRDNIHLSA